MIVQAFSWLRSFSSPLKPLARQGLLHWMLEVQRAVEMPREEGEAKRATSASGKILLRHKLWQLLFFLLQVGVGGGGGEIMCGLSVPSMALHIGSCGGIPGTGNIIYEETSITDLFFFFFV